MWQMWVPMYCVQAGERITLPYKIQSLAPPKGYGSAGSAGAVTQAPDGTAAKQAAAAAAVAGAGQRGIFSL